MKENLLGDQAKSFGNLITNKKFIIPPYQRGYRWNKKNWNNFYESVFGLENKPYDDIHYIGNIIIKKNKTSNKKYVKYDIVDGHQRLATFFIFFAAMMKIIEHLVEEGKVNTGEMRGYEDLKKDIIKLIFIDPDLDEEDNSKNELKFDPHKDFESLDLKNLFSNRVGETNDFHPFSTIKKAFDFFRKELEKNSKMSSLIGAKSIFRLLNERLEFTIISLPEETTSQEVLEIFDIINDTGQHLEPADKLRGFLFEKAIEEKDDEEGKLYSSNFVKKYWEEMEKKLKNDPIKINSFLYNFLASNFKRDKDLTKKEFYQFAKKQFDPEKNIAPDVMNLLTKLERYSEFYKAIVDPVNFSPQNNFERELKKLLIDVKRLGYYQLHQLILTLNFDDHLKPVQKFEVLDSIIKCMFRRITVKDLKASKEFEKRIQNWVIFLQNSEGEKILEDEYLKNEFELREEHEEFYNKLRTRILKKDRYRYIMGKYYLALNPKIFQYSGNEEIEHLAPQNIVKKENHPWKRIEEWKKDEKTLEKLINSIGNLTIIEDSSNREAKDKLWSKKIKNHDYINNICLRFEVENKSKLIDEKIKNGKELYPEEIENRTRKLVEEIEKLGIFEFSSWLKK